MITTDYHLHSTHSADGHGSILEMCEAALAAGLTEIGFAEHIDFDRTDPHYGYLDGAAYTEAV
ncbi:MAG: PHP domain-containing protein, partial [Planctomycetes bacterium]|nr:PHP domain-containing protein [Planctomycetota bacterium]